MSELQSRFARRLEAEYERRAASYGAQGMDALAAHRRAFKEAKDLGRRVLNELNRRGLYPFPTPPTDGPTGHDVAVGGGPT